MPKFITQGYRGGSASRLLSQGYAYAAGPAGQFDPVGAVAAYWAAAPALRALASDGRLWLDEIPESIDLPRCAASLERDSPDAWTTGYVLRRASLALTVYARTAGAARAAALSAAAALWMAPLTYDGVAASHCLPDEDSIQVSPDRGPRGQDCWAAAISIEVLYTRQRPTPAP